MRINTKAKRDKKQGKIIGIIGILIAIIVGVMVFSHSRNSDYIDQLVKKYKTMGASVTIIENGAIKETRNYGYANKKEHELVSENTQFKIASISKTITSYAVMQLVEEGKLDLDAPVNRYLKKWKIPVSTYGENQVTLRNLMSHTAGITGSDECGYQEPLPTIEQALEARNIQLKRTPGIEFEYSEFAGLGICQLVIEDITGQKFEDYMVEHIFQPLGMYHTDYTNSSNDRGNLATPYAGKNKAIEVTPIVMNGGGGVSTTSIDLAKFGMALMDYYHSGNKEMFTPQKNTESVGGVYGLGIIPRELSDGRVVYEHNGTLTGWNAQLVIEPESQNGIVVVTNSDKAYYLTYALMEQWSKNTLGEAVKDSQMVSIEKQVLMTIGALLFIILTLVILTAVKIKKGKLMWEPNKHIKKIFCVSAITLVIGILYYFLFYSDYVFSLLFGLENYFLYTFFPLTLKYINLELLILGCIFIMRTLFGKICVKP